MIAQPPRRCTRRSRCRRSGASYAVAVYWVIGVPPREIGAPQLTVTLDGVVRAVTPTGEAGDGHLLGAPAGPIQGGHAGDLRPVEVGQFDVVTRRADELACASPHVVGVRGCHRLWGGGCPEAHAELHARVKGLIHRELIGVVVRGAACGFDVPECVAAESCDLPGVVHEFDELPGNPRAVGVGAVGRRRSSVGSLVVDVVERSRWRRRSRPWALPLAADRCSRPWPGRCRSRRSSGPSPRRRSGRLSRAHAPASVVPWYAFT